VAKRKSRSKKSESPRRTRRPRVGSGPHLVLVESPNKIKSIKRYLGDDYIVLATRGHFRSLFERTPMKEPPEDRIFPEDEDARWDVEEFLQMFPARKGDDPLRPETNTARYLGVQQHQGHYVPIYRVTNYSVIPKLLEVIQNELGRGSVIYLATDPDREGEGIAWHVQEMLEQSGELPPGIRFMRARFNAIAKKEITEAIKNAEPSLVHGFVAAYQSREMLDRLIGYPASRALWKMNIRGPGNRGLSLGRVQFAALDMLMSDEEKSLQQLPSITHKIEATASAHGREFPVTMILDEKIQGDERELKKQLESIPATVAGFKQDQKAFWPRPPHKTATFQADMNRYHNVKADRALRLAQKLYEQGQCTYIRTDSEAVSGLGASEIMRMAQDLGLQGRGHVKSGKAGRNAQEAHEALRPKYQLLAQQMVSSIRDGGPFKVGGYDADELKAFELMFRRSVAASLPDATGDERMVGLSHPTVPAGMFEGESVKVTDPGFYAIWTYDSPETKHELPILHEGEQVRLSNVEFTATVRSAPRAYASSLIMRMDKAGIGRPSSNGSLLSTLEKRGYVRKGMSRFGMTVTALAREGFGDALSLDTTQNMEESLALLAEGRQEITGVLDGFYRPFAGRLDYMRALASNFGKDAATVRGYLDTIHLFKVQGIFGIKEEPDQPLLQALENYRPGFWHPWGSLCYCARSFADHTGVFLGFWRDEHGIVGRMYWLFHDKDGNPYTMMLTILGENESEVSSMLDWHDWAAQRLMAQPVMGYPEAWSVFIGILRESQRQVMQSIFDPDGSFPLMNRADGPNTVHRLVYGEPTGATEAG